MVKKRSIEQQNQCFYDEEAQDYDQLRYSSRGGKRLDRFHKLLLSEMLIKKLPRNAKVLELGCGTGRLLSHFSDMKLELIGLDVSTGMLAAGRKLHPELHSLIHGNAVSLPFSDCSLDAVYAILVLNLFPDHQSVLVEISRILRPGGLLMFNLPNLGSIYFPGGLYVNLKGHTVRGNRTGYRYSHWFTRSEIVHNLSVAGLRVRGVWGQPAHVTLTDGVAPWPAQGLSAMGCKSLYYLAERTET